MSLQSSEHFEEITNLVQDFVSEIELHKSVIERMLSSDYSICPTLIFYSSPTQKDYFIALNDQQSFDLTLPKISEALHFFSARDSHSVLVILSSDLAIDEVIYKSINFFIASSSCAFVYYLPYTFVNSDAIVWHDDKAIVEQLEKIDVDQNGTDFIHTLHAHLHVENSPFDSSEILNYLSYNGFAIQALDEKNIVPYIDMSTFNYGPIAYLS